MTPVRIQLSRRRGWRKPPNTVSVARPGRYGNPYVVGKHGDAAFCVKMFAETVRGHWSPGNVDHLDDAAAAEIYRLHCAWRQRLGGHPVEFAQLELHGKNLACWCRLCAAHKDGNPLGVECSDCAPCHGDEWLKVANG